MEFNHVPVMLNEAVDNLIWKRDGIYVDSTLGGAGHSEEILKRLSQEGRLIGIDRDTNAIKAAEGRLKIYNDRKVLVHSNFSEIKAVLKRVNVDKVDGILMDLGVSSYQLDTAERGFSYMQDAPLDMRMDSTWPISASDIINNYSEVEIKEIIDKYGEERWASRIASFIVKRRQIKPITTTGELVEVIKSAIPAGARREGPHPAKRTFQAIRIAVNRELEEVEKVIPDAVDVLNGGGRICIITFHSLEDRIVKDTFKKIANPCTCPPEFPVCVCGNEPKIRIITRKPIAPSHEEIESNPRARSAKLRVAEKI